MAAYMFDTSGLVKYYTAEIGSEKVREIIDDSANSIFISKRGLRTLDALQLAIAIHLKSQSSLDGFVCADDKLRKIAKLEKIAFINPEVL